MIRKDSAAVERNCGKRDKVNAQRGFGAVVDELSGGSRFEPGILLLVFIEQFFIFPGRANTETIENGRFSQEGRPYLMFFYQLTKKSNPGRLGEKQECYLSAMPSTPLFYIKLVGKKDPGNYGT